MVAIVDPHVKRTDDYRIYTDARDLDVLVKRADGSNFEGWCWPGSSVWVDFFNPKSWDWWTRMFKMDVWKVCLSRSDKLPLLTILGVSFEPIHLERHE
jgi:alpha 1,3-glucosidase